MSTGQSSDAPMLPAAAFEADPMAGFRAPSGEAGGGGFDIKRYMAALGRYKLLIVGMGALGLLVGVGLTQVIKPMYEAQASVQIPVTVRGFSGQQSSMLRSPPLLDGRGWLELLRSFAVLDQVVREHHLFIERKELGDSIYFAGFDLAEGFVPGEYELTTQQGRVLLRDIAGNVVDQAAPGDSLGRPIGLRWVPAAPPEGHVAEFRVRVPRDAAVALGGDLTTVLPQDGALLRLSLRGQDPNMTAAVVNSMATRFVDVAMLLKREKLTTVTEVLREQLASARSDLTNAETALETYKVSTITLPSERGATQIAPGLAQTADPVRDAFFQLRIDRDALQRDRDAILRALANASDTSASYAVTLGTIPTVREAAEITSTLELLTTKRAEARQLRLAFSESHPEVRKVAREIEELERTTIPSQARALASDLNTRIGDFDQRISASSREMQAIPARSTEEARRVREVDVSNLIYTELQSAYEQARLAELSAAPDIRLLDLAVPPTRPVRDQLIMLLAGGFMGGLGIGLALAILLDRLDKRLRYPEQVTNELGLQILGALPLVGTRRDGTPDPEASSQLVESLRSVRTSLVYSHGTAGPFITTITSPGSGDGKSFTSLNLAMSFASAGRRTLLIDGDARRGALHRSLGVSRKPGLLDYLSGESTREEVVHRIEARNIDFIPCGTRKSSAPELLATPAMQQLIMALRTEYGAIIIDSPPLGAGVDPLILASLSGSLVLVLRTGVTDRELAGARLDDLARLPIRVLGAVLNDVQTGSLYRQYSYLPGYRSEDEGEGDADIVLTPKVLPSKR